MKRLAEHAVASPWTVLVLVIVGGALRLAVAGQDLYADELATYWVATAHSATGVVETVATTAEITPPLSFLLTWLATRLGESPEIVRLPSLVAGVAAIPLVWLLGRRTVGQQAATLAAALTALSPFMVFYSAEARGYGVLTTLVLLSTLSLLRAVDGGGTRWWVAYSAFVAAAMYTHYTGLFVLLVQAIWALATRPGARRPLIAATAIAALAYVPWLPSVRGDLDSPTTEILSAFYPISLEGVRLTLGHWSVGFPFALPSTSLRDLPGLGPLLMLAVTAAVALHGAATRRAVVSANAGPSGAAGVTLVVLLAVATPAGTLLQSAIGTNVFAVRSLAVSWPYLAVSVAGLVAAARPAPRLVAATLAVSAFAVGAGTMLTDDFRRPDFERLARFADEHPGAVVVNNAAFTPGPLTNFEVEGSVPEAPILRLNVPEQMESPFTLVEPRPVPEDIAQRAVAEADGGPIIIISGVPQPAPVLEVVDLLPAGYEATDEERIGGLFEVQAVVYERR